MDLISNAEMVLKKNKVKSNIEAKHFYFRCYTLVYAVIFFAALDIHRIRTYNSWHISIFCSLEKFKVSKTILVLSFISIKSIFFNYDKNNTLLYDCYNIPIMNDFLSYFIAIVLILDIKIHKNKCAIQCVIVSKFSYGPHLMYIQN